MTAATTFQPTTLNAAIILKSPSSFFPIVDRE